MEQDTAEIEVRDTTSVTGSPDTTEEWLRQLNADAGRRARPEIEEALELAREVLWHYTTSE